MTDWVPGPAAGECSNNEDHHGRILVNEYAESQSHRGTHVTSHGYMKDLG